MSKFARTSISIINMSRKLELNDTLSMKGVAITFIILHNLIHLICPIKENEFNFNIDHSKAFISHLLNLNNDLWIDIFSFLGWYGVPVFLFISGYGLVQKYEKNKTHKDVGFFQFTKKHFKKLFLLMIIPYVIYLLLHWNSINLKAVFAQSLMISNLYSSLVHPGIYWYFGLMLQLYIAYYLFIFNKPQKNIVYLILLQFIIIAFCYYVLDNSKILSGYPSLKFVLSSYNMLHNSIGWFLPFAIGIIYARYNFNIAFNHTLLNLLLFVGSSFLLIVSNLNFISWLLSPILAISSAISLNALIKPLKNTNKIFVYIGGISAFLFATHPLVRSMYFNVTTSLSISSVLLYALVCILVAICYKVMHRKLQNTFQH